MNGEAKREELLRKVDADEHELQVAVADLEEAVRRPLAITEQIGGRIAEHPVAWLMGSVLFGVWLGSRAA
jgi:hypothetical protein